MTTWNQQAGQMNSATGIPVEIQQLAASYQVGIPVRSYQTAFSKVGFCVVTLFSLVIISLGVANLFFSSQNPNSAHPQGALQGTGPSLLLTGIGVLLLCFSAYSLINRLRGSKDMGYECTEGFLQVDKRGALKSALRWDQMQGLWERVEVAQYKSQSNPQTSYRTICSVAATSGLETRIDYPDLWRRIKDEFVRRNLPQVIALFNAGRQVPFNTLLVNQQGISQDPSHMPGKSDTVSWQELTRVYKTNHDLCFEGSHTFLQLHILRVPISQTANLCLLDALLYTVSGGRVIIAASR